MSSQITLTLRDDVMRRAEHVAQGSGRQVADVLKDAIETTFTPLGSAALSPVTGLPDDELLAVADSMMKPREGRRFNELLARQSEGPMTPAERAEFLTLVQIHDEGILRKSEAIAEVARRGLRGPPKP